MKIVTLKTWRPKAANRKICAHRTEKSARPGVVIATTIGAMLLLGGIGTDAFGANRAPAVMPAGFAAAPAPEIKACLPLLKIAHQHNAGSTTHGNTDATISSETGRAAMLALILGVQNVVGPAETGRQKQKATLPQPRIANSGQDTGHAIAVAAYRRCVSQKTLEARNAVLNDWRWTR